jgi:hypothetical protein
MWTKIDEERNNAGSSIMKEEEQVKPTSISLQIDLCHNPKLVFQSTLSNISHLKNL